MGLRQGMMGRLCGLPNVPAACLSIWCFSLRNCEHMFMAIRRMFYSIGIVI